MLTEDEQVIIMPKYLQILLLNYVLLSLLYENKNLNFIINLF